MLLLFCWTFWECRQPGDTTSKSASITLCHMFVLYAFCVQPMNRSAEMNIMHTSSVLSVLICIKSLSHEMPMLLSMFACAAQICIAQTDTLSVERKSYSLNRIHVCDLDNTLKSFSPLLWVLMNMSWICCIIMLILYFKCLSF